MKAIIEMNGKPKEIWKPNFLYADDEAYNSMSKEQRTWLKEFNAFKYEIDSIRLEGHHGVYYRAPQFKSTTLEAISQQGFNGNLWLQRAKEIFIKDANDTEFGSEESDMEVENASSELKEKRLIVKSIPVYGVKKLETQENMSIDLFHTMAMYIDMACNYRANRDVANGLEVIKHYMENHRLVGNSKGDYTASNSHKLIDHIMDVNLYGRVYGDFGTKHKVVMKLFGNLTGIAVNLMLRWNIKGGNVNTMTGMIELFKEACTGEDFTVENLTKAFKDYIETMCKSGFFGFFQEMFQLGRKTQDAYFGNSKIELMIRYFDMLGKNENLNREWFTSTVGNAENFKNFYSKLSLSPYGSGEHLMQTLSFLACYNNHVLYRYNPSTDSLTSIKLQDLYEVDDNEGYKYLVRKDEIVIKKKEDLENLKVYLALKAMLDNAKENKDVSFLQFSFDQVKWLNDRGFNNLSNPVT